jgi:putative RNA 2'-phosphotransferase
MDAERLRSISKLMSWALRHAAQELKLSLDPEGFVLVDDLLAVVHQQYPSATRETLVRVIEQVQPSKQRFQLEGAWIRANYGHSLAQNVAHPLQSPPETLFHGTSIASAHTILETGLRPMRRQYVHLTADPALALQVGARHGTPCLLIVSTVRAHAAGIRFYLANEKFWLADAIPPQFVSLQRPSAPAVADI